MLLHENLVAIEYFKIYSDYQVFLQSSSVKILFLWAVCTQKEVKEAWKSLLFILEHNVLWWPNSFKEGAEKATDPDKWASAAGSSNESRGMLKCITGLRYDSTNYLPATKINTPKSAHMMFDALTPMLLWFIKIHV